MLFDWVTTSMQAPAPNSGCDSVSSDWRRGPNTFQGTPESNMPARLPPRGCRPIQTAERARTYLEQKNARYTQTNGVFQQVESPHLLPAPT